jgi:uncharacterized membrane protein YbjE (DUF340 family)
MRSRNGNHGSGMMNVRMCLISILTVKVKHHARIEMINTFLSMIIYIYTAFIGIVYNRKQKKKEKKRM